MEKHIEARMAKFIINQKRTFCEINLNKYSPKLKPFAYSSETDNIFA